MNFREELLSAVFNTEASPRIAAEELIMDIYNRYHKEKPVIEWYDSPFALPKKLTGVDRAAGLYSIAGRHSISTQERDFVNNLSNTMARVDRSTKLPKNLSAMAHRVNMISNLLLQSTIANTEGIVNHTLKCVIEISRMCSYFQMAEGRILFVERPAKFEFAKDPATGLVDERYMLSNDKGHSIEWKDGKGLYFWKNIEIPSSFTKGKETITKEMILKIKNAEIRSAVVDLVGAELCLKILGAKTLHKDDFGELFRIEMDLGRGTNLQMVKVRNSTPEPDGTYKDYYLWVPPNVQTAKEAVASTFGLNIKEYEPMVES